MNKLLLVLTVVVCGVPAANAQFSLPWEKPPRRAHRQPSPKPHDRHDGDKALAGGILHAVGAVTELVDHSVNGPETVVVQQPTTVVVSQPAVVQQPQTVVVSQPSVVQPASATTGPVVVPANNVVLRPAVADQSVMTVAAPGEPALETVYIPATYSPPPSYFVKPIVIPLQPLHPW